jgi:glyoxylase-like metal-dependent hydrolase (beta-lactamase superfamily II)
MSTARVLAVALGLLLVVPLVVGVGLLVWVEAQLPQAQGERVRGPHGVVGIQSGGSYAWVVPSETGVVLVDAGLDPSAAPLEAEIGRRPVEGVLLTHGHGDHTGGLASLPSAPVWIGEGDLGLLDGTREPRGWLAASLARLFGHLELHGPVTTIRERQEVVIDGLRFLAVPVPGHTDGSVAWLWEDLLFTGDAVFGGPQPSLPVPALDDDPAQAEQSLKLLLPLDFDGLADGHLGYTGGARASLFRLAAEKVTEPTISVRSAGGAGTSRERTGIYVQWPVRDARGDQPALVAFPDGPPWRISSQPAPDRADWNGRAVVVRARVLGAGAGPGLAVDLESIALAETQPDPNRPLKDRIGEWTTVRGTVRRLDPLTGGAAWGSGELALADGSTVPVSAPVDGVPVGAPTELTVLVQRDGDGLRLVAAPAAALN